MRELCDDLHAWAGRGRPLSVECRALSMDQAVLLGLIINELVTNAIKHALPGGRAGHIRISFEALGSQLRLAVG
jgi:two-component sensor histidine kinase